MASHTVPAIAAAAHHHLPAATTNLATITMAPDNAAISAAAGLSKPKFIFSPPEKQNELFSVLQGPSFKQHWMSPRVYLRKNPLTLSSDLRLIPILSALSLIGTAHPPGEMIQ